MIDSVLIKSYIAIQIPACFQQKGRNMKKILSLFFLMSVIAITLFSCTQQEEPGFRFAFLTDIHIMTDNQAVPRFEKAIDKVNSMNPDFVITGGDMIADALGQNEEKATEYYQLFNSLLPQFKMPVYETMGNHEVFGLYEKSGVQPENPLYGKAMYKEKLGEGKTWYSFDHKGWHFIILDGIGFTDDRQYIGYVNPEELKWLQRDLVETGKKTPIMVSIHIPLVSVMEQMQNGSTAAASEGMVVTNSVDVIKAFEGYNLKLVLQGHLHIVEEIIYKDVHYITGGAVSGAWWNGPKDGFPPGFVIVDIKGDGFDWSYETFNDVVPQKPAAND